MSMDESPQGTSAKQGALIDAMLIGHDAYSKGYMQGLADAQKAAVSAITGKNVLKKVWIQCPVCKTESPFADPDAELLNALRHIEGVAMADEPRDLPGIVQTARAAIAKVEGRS